MPSYSPTLFFSPGLSVTMAGNITYDEFIGSLSSNVHIIKSIFVASLTFEQLNQAMQYSIFDAAGNKVSEIIPLIPDPYRYQPALILPKPPFGMVLNGQSSFAFNILPGETVQLIVCTDVISLQQNLDKFSESNFKKIGLSPVPQNSNACP
jgi:hypothetical protein